MPSNAGPLSARLRRSQVFYPSGRGRRNRLQSGGRVRAKGQRGKGQFCQPALANEVGQRAGNRYCQEPAAGLQCRVIVGAMEAAFPATSPLNQPEPPMDQGIDGFLPGSRASIMLDLVFLAMFLVLPVMAWSIAQARQGKYLLHKRVQIALGLILLVAVTAFEVDMRFFTNWDARAADSPYYSRGVYAALYIHLVFAVSTAFIWIGVIVAALRKFPSPPTPGPHSKAHRRWGWIAAWDMALTAITGWIFYYLAFWA